MLLLLCSLGARVVFAGGSAAYPCALVPLSPACPLAHTLRPLPLSPSQLTIREFEQNGVRVRDGTKLYLDQNRAKGLAMAMQANQAAAAAAAAHPAVAAQHQQAMMGGAAAAAAMAGAR